MIEAGAAAFQEAHEQRYPFDVRLRMAYLAMHSLSASGDVERALRPFANEGFEHPVADENGWTDFGLSWCQERIVDWFGPSDFHNARTALTASGNSAASCDLCVGECRGHSLGRPEDWEPEKGSRASLARNLHGASGNSGAVSDDLRPEVLAFARLMERELRANDHKPGWKNDSLDSLAERVSDEAAELSQAVRKLTRQVVWRDAHTPGERGNGWSRQLHNGQRQVCCGYREMEGEERQAQLAKIISEAADVANMAMMAADVCALLNEGERS